MLILSDVLSNDLYSTSFTVSSAVVIFLLTDSVIGVMK